MALKAALWAPLKFSLSLSPDFREESRGLAEMRPLGEYRRLPELGRLFFFFSSLVAHVIGGEEEKGGLALLCGWPAGKLWRALSGVSDCACPGAVGASQFFGWRACSFRRVCASVEGLGGLRTRGGCGCLACAVKKRPRHSTNSQVRTVAAQGIPTV